MKQICLFFILALMVFSANSYAGLEDGLVSVWNFDDGTANDAVGDNDGEFMNGASTTDAEFGMALNLENPENPATGENTGQYVEIPSSSSLEKEGRYLFCCLVGLRQTRWRQKPLRNVLQRRQGRLGCPFPGADVYHERHQYDLGQLLGRG